MSSDSEEDAFSGASESESESDHEESSLSSHSDAEGVEPEDDILVDSPVHNNSSSVPGSVKKRKANALASAQKIKPGSTSKSKKEFSKVTVTSTIKKNRMVIDSDDDDDDDFEEDIKKKSKKEKDISPKTSPQTSPKASKKSVSAPTFAPVPVPAPKKTVVASSNNKPLISPPKQMGSSSSTITTNAAVVVDITRGPPVQTESKARELILKYIKQQNRPYSAVQIYDNLHHRIVKGTVERVLENAAQKAESGIRVKEYGKSKIYFPDQSKMEVATPNMLANLDREIDDLQAQVKQAHQQEYEHKQELNKIRSEPNDDEIDALLAEKEATVKALQERLSAFSNSPVDENALENTIIRYNFYRSKWIERKRGVMDVVDNIADGMDKKVNKVCEEIGIETDVEYKMVLPPKIDTIKRAPLGTANR